MATKLEVAKFLFGAAGQSSPGERAGTLAGGGNTSVRYGTVKTVDGTSVSILMEDTGETLYTMTTTPVAVGDRVAIIKNGQSVVVYATDQLVEMINKTVVDGDAEYAVGDDAYIAPKSGWSTTMPDVEQGEYLWMRYKTTLKDGTVKTSTPVCLTSAGGLVITSSEVSYAIGTSGTTPPSSGWQSTPPTAKPGQYLWSREVTEYSDGTSMTSYGVSYQGTNGQDGANGADGADGANGADGKDGVGIADSDVTWQKSSSGTTPPTGTWLQSPPDLNPGDYLWTRTVWTYTDGSSTTAYSVSKAGDTGPQGIQGPPGENGEPRYTWIKYADSASGAGMSDNPNGKDYMGIAYNKESPTESNDPNDYDWSLIRGADGQDGPAGPQGPQGIPGPAGADGVNGADGQTSYFHVKYAPNGNPTSDQMTDTVNSYIGTYVDFIPNDSTNPKKYKWVKIEGMDGADGIPGQNGEDGRTSYLHVAYANSADGRIGFSTTDAANKQYIGQYVDFVQNDSPDSTSYKWTKIKGDKGDQGIPGPSGVNGETYWTWIKYADDDQGTGMSDKPEGKDYIGIAYNKDTPIESWVTTDYAWSLIKGETGVGIDKVRDMYYLSTSNTEVTGGTWVYDECPEWQEGRYIWTRMEITYDDESVHFTDPVLMSALNQANQNAAKVTWYVSSDDEGLHISSVKNNPNGGINILLTGDRLQFRDGTTVIGQYTGSGITFMGNSGSDALNIAKDLLGTVYLGGDIVRLYFGQMSGTMASLTQVSVKDVVMMAGYSGDQITRCCSASKTLTSSDSAITIGKTLGEFSNSGVIYVSGAYVRVLNQFYQSGGTVTVEVSASATAGEMSSGKNLALSIYMGTSASFSSATAVATAITSSANVMTAATIAPVTIEVTTRYAYFFLAARSTGGGGVLDPYSTQPAYCPKLTVRVVGQTYS